MAERTIAAQCGRLFVAGVLTAVVIGVTLWQLASSSAEVGQTGVSVAFSTR